jgi:hypothetical protein
VGQGHPGQQPGSAADPWGGAGALRDVRIACAAPQGDPPVAELGGGVDQDISDEVDVDRVARPAREPEHLGGKLLDGAA